MAAPAGSSHGKTRTAGLHESLARVTPHVEFVMVNMTKGAFELRPSQSAGDSQSNEAHLQAAFRHTVESGSLRATVDFDMEAPARTPTGGTVVHVSATFVVTYRLSVNAPGNGADIEAFARINGAFNAWPYLREFFQGAVVRMGLPPPMFPPLTIARAIEIAGYPVGKQP